MSCSPAAVKPLKRPLQQQQQRPHSQGVEARHSIGMYRKALAGLVCLSAVCMLAWYAHRTWHRNRDWVSEEALFDAALQVSTLSILKWPVAFYLL